MPRPVSPHTTFLKTAVSTKSAAKESEKSTQWIRDQVVKLAHGDGHLKVKKLPGSKRVNKVGDQQTNKLRLGQMVFFVYDPKNAKTLPYYDQFPLIFPLTYQNNGNFLGINLHYLPPSYRAAFLDKLYEIMEKRGMTDKAKLRLTASLMNEVRKMPEFKACVKAYIPDHVRSLFLPVPPEEWDYTILLNSDNFAKASKTQVWRDSLSKMNS